MTITASAMLVELNISTWTATTTDKGATDKAIIDANATTGAGQFKKNLMAGTNKRKLIADFAQGCRHWHGMRTLPWHDKGGRLLPVSLFFEYKAEASKRREQFEAMVNDFVADYPVLVEQAKANLGSLFDASDYPSEDKVKDKFGFRLVFSPVPEAGDFRIDAPKADLEALREQYEENYNVRLGEAMASSWERLHTLISGMSAKLADEGETDKKKRYHDTFLGNAQELCGMLTHLNVTNDPKLEQARRDLEKAIAGVEMEDIRLDPLTRSGMKDRLDAVLRGYEW